MLRLSSGVRLYGRVFLAPALLPVLLAPVSASAVATHASAHPVPRSAAHPAPAHKAKAEPVPAHSAASRHERVKEEPVGARSAKNGHVGSRRVSANEDEPAAKHSGRNTGATGKAAGKGKNSHAKPEPAAGRGGKPSKSSGKRRGQVTEPDYDPPVMNRAGMTRGARKERPSTAVRVRVAEVADTHEAPAHTQKLQEEAGAATPTGGGLGTAFPDGEISGHHDRHPGPAAVAARHGTTPAGAVPSPSGPAAMMAPAADHGQATNEDFLRAAGIARTPAPAPAAVVASAAQSEVFARGESHPDDDVRVDMTVPPARAARTSPASATARRPQAAIAPLPTTVPPVMAIVSAPPPSAATVPGTGLVATTAGLLRKKTRADILPEDLAGKDAVIADAMRPMVLPNLYGSDGRLMVPPPMRGSREILVHQNTMADSDGLTRIQDDDDLNRMRAAHLLVPIADSEALEVNQDLPVNRRAARPWTAQFVNDISRAYYLHFHQPLRLSSAVRTVAYQLRLQRVNGNAAAVDGDGASPHLTGQAIDFGKHGMSVTEIAWMRATLKPLVDSGKIDVEEEFQQACFHISVYRAYAPAAPAAVKKPRTMDVAQVRQAPAPIVRRPPVSQPADQVDNSVIESPDVAATEAVTPDQH